MTNKDDYVYIVFRGLPDEFGSYDEATGRAAELCERDHEDYSVLAVDRDSLKASVARYHGVVIHTLEEVQRDE